MHVDGMSMLSKAEQAENLRAFFAQGANSVTRERIFFNRLAFDLKIEAARAGYHLHLYEPDVDRDGFDIVVEDQSDGIGWFQLKAVLRSASTASWSTTVGFIRPQANIGELLGFDPVECGRGGGIILIEIDDTTARGDVVYSYTDFRVLTVLAERYLIERASEPVEKARGRPPVKRQVSAAGIVAGIRNGQPDDVLAVPRKAFLEVIGPDALLALMGMSSSTNYAPFGVQHGYRDGVHIDEQGKGIVTDARSIDALGALRYHMHALVEVLGPSANLKAFDFTAPNSSTMPSI